jgi:hypothetical protein
VGTSDGRAYLSKSLSARPDDPSFAFAAALMVADQDRPAYERHAQKARDGAGRDPLLARNLKHVS